MNENNKDKASLVVSKILRETQEGSIKWSIFYNNKSDIQSDDDTFVIGNVYVTHIDTKDFRIYRFKLKIETSPFIQQIKKNLKAGIVTDWNYIIPPPVEANGFFPTQMLFMIFMKLYALKFLE